MFNGLKQVRQERGYLVDEKGITYMQTPPIRAVELKFYGKPYVRETPAPREFFGIMRELESISPRPNAWSDEGVLKEGFETLQLPEMNLDGSTWREPKEVAYKIKKIQFYWIASSELALLPMLPIPRISSAT